MEIPTTSSSIEISGPSDQKKTLYLKTFIEGLEAALKEHGPNVIVLDYKIHLAKI